MPRGRARAQEGIASASSIFEIDGWCVFGAFRTFKITFGGESKHPRKNVRGETLRADVKGAHGIVKVPACRGDPILGSLELCHEITECLRGLELRIAFDRHQEPSQRGIKIFRSA